MLEQRNNAAGALIGRWATDPNDTDSLREYGRTTLDFGPDGKLTYIIHGDGKDDIMLLTYRIDGGMIVTNQPSAPNEEYSAFTVTPEGVLIIEFGGIQSRYVRTT